jgi:hypothetical protein
VTVFWVLCIQVVIVSTWKLLMSGVTVLGLLMVVMRALLQQPTTLRTDMEAII